MAKLPSNLPLHRLFLQLENKQFRIGPSEKLRVYQLLSDEGGKWMDKEERASLKYSLAPILCRSSLEQEVFYKVYDDFLKWLEEPLPPEYTPPSTQKASNFERKVEKAFLLLALFLVLLGIAIGVWSYLDGNGYFKKYVIVYYQLGGTDQTATINQTLNYAFSFSPDSLKGAVSVDTLIGVDREDLLDYEWEVVEYYEEGSSLVDTVIGFSQRGGAKGLTYTVPRLDSLDSGTTGFQFDVHLNFYKKDSTQLLRQIARNLEVECLKKPMPDSGIKIRGNRLVGEEIQLIAPKDIKPGWALTWASVGIGSPPNIVGEHEHIAKITFQEKGFYRIVLTISDTLQHVRCATTVSIELEIGEEIPQPQPLLLKKSPLITKWERTPLFVIMSWLALIALLIFFGKWMSSYSITPPQLPVGKENLRQAFEQKTNNQQAKPPFTIPFRGNNNLVRIVAEQKEFANILRRRKPSQETNLHIQKTVNAAIQQQGFVELKYVNNTRPSHYLFLIDVQTETSHQAQLFQYLVGMLMGQDVLAEVFFYRSDFFHCWSHAKPSGMSIEQLAQDYHDHRLVIFGDGRRLVSGGLPAGETLRMEWKKVLRRWQQRMLITPVPIRSWGYAENRLYQVLAVFQADINGIMQAAQFVSTGMSDEDLPPTFSEWLNFSRKAKINVDTNRAWDSPIDHLAYFVRSGNPELLYRWLRALIVYPELNWNITIAIGKELGIDVNYDHLLMLSRVPWMQEGGMRYSLWKSWWDGEEKLPEEDEIKARKAVKQELEAVANKCADGHSNQKLQIRLAVQNFALHPTDEEAKETMRYVLSNITPSAQLKEELDFVVYRRLPNYPKRKQVGATAAAYLSLKPENANPLLNPNFALGLFCLAFYALYFLIQPSTWSKVSPDLNFLTDWMVNLNEQPLDSAAQLNDLAVEYFYGNDFPQDSLTELSKEGFDTTLSSNNSRWAKDRLDKALELKPSFTLASSNRSMIFFNEAVAIINKDGDQTPAINHLLKIVSINDKDSIYTDSLHSLAAEALGIAYFKQKQIDSACFWIRRVRLPDYFNWLAARGSCIDADFSLNLLLVDEANNRPLSDVSLRNQQLPPRFSGKDGRVYYTIDNKEIRSSYEILLRKKGYLDWNGSIVPNTDGRIDTIRMARDLDGDLIADIVDRCPITPGNLPDGCPSVVVDSDADGVPDSKDECPNVKGSLPNGCDPEKPPTQPQPITDSDGDGEPDDKDGCPKDKAKTTPGACGCGIEDTDTDDDGVPDCLDSCPDVLGEDKSGCPAGVLVALASLRSNPPSIPTIQKALEGFKLLEPVRVNEEEAQRVLRHLGVSDARRMDVQGNEPFLYGQLGSGSCISIWVGTYQKKDRYGLRFGNCDLSYHRSNATYFEFPAMEAVRLIRTIDVEYPINGIAISPDGTKLIDVGGSNGEFRVWDLQNGKMIERLMAHQQEIIGISSSTKARIFATVGKDSAIRIWDWGKMVNLATLMPRMEISSIKLSPDGRYVLGTGELFGTAVWNVKTERQEFYDKSLRYQEGRSAQFSDNGKSIIVVGARSKVATLEVIDLKTGKPVSQTGIQQSRFKLPGKNLTTDGNGIAVSYSNGDIEVMDYIKDKQGERFTGHTDDVLQIAFSADGKWMASCSTDGTTIIWDMGTLEKKAVLESKDLVTNLDFSADSKRLAMATKLGRIKIYALD